MEPTPVPRHSDDEFAERHVSIANGFDEVDSSHVVVIRDPELPLDKDIVSMLDPALGGIAIERLGNSVTVLFRDNPDPGTYRLISDAIGTPVQSARAASPELFDHIAERAIALRVSSPVDLGRALDAGVELRASDLHIQVGRYPILRVRGDLVELAEDFSPLTAETLDSFAEWLSKGSLVPGQMDWDGAAVHNGRRWRVNLAKQRGHWSAVMRLINETTPSIENLGLPSVLREFANYTEGLVLFAGPTGSGKSTSLAALIDLINVVRKDKIVTIEDPVEYVFTDKNCTIVQREVGGDTASFADAIRAALRQDPDIILLGELRDRPTIEAALTAAETGHVVFATVHARDSESSINRIIDIFPGDQQNQVRSQLAASLRAVVTQRLLKRIDIAGRQLVTEVLICNDAARNNIRTNNLSNLRDRLDTGRDEGMHSFDYSLAQAVAAQAVAKEDAMNYCIDAERFHGYLESLSGRDGFTY